ncbi:hypothetical protein SBRCBS47491_000891 [Sporothrix bragantina]|uniref:Uncharacterized protein n=1 Tax=Sporothrix bragantina TaxID=671064 RepID=A0ABP0AU34_9PEZI
MDSRMITALDAILTHDLVREVLIVVQPRLSIRIAIVLTLLSASARIALGTILVTLMAFEVWMVLWSRKVEKDFDERDARDREKERALKSANDRHDAILHEFERQLDVALLVQQLNEDQQRPPTNRRAPKNKQGQKEKVWVQELREQQKTTGVKIRTRLTQTSTQQADGSMIGHLAGNPGKMPPAPYHEHIVRCVIAIQFDDGNTLLSFYNASELVDEFIENVAETIVQHAITHGSCAGMDPPMPAYEAYNHFALFLMDPTNLLRYVNDNTIGYAKNGARSAQMVTEIHERDGETLRATTTGIDPSSDALHGIRRSYVRLLQVYALARVLLKLENNKTPSAKPRCPEPTLFAAYRKILPLLNRVACQDATPELDMVNFVDFGALWRDMVDNFAGDYGTYYFNMIQRTYRYNAYENGAGDNRDGDDINDGMYLLYFCSAPGEYTDDAQIPPWREMIECVQHLETINLDDGSMLNIFSNGVNNDNNNDNDSNNDDSSNNHSHSVEADAPSMRQHVLRYMEEQRRLCAILREKFLTPEHLRRPGPSRQ